MKYNFEALEIRMALTTSVLSPLRREPHPLHFDALIISLMTARKKQKYPLLIEDVHGYNDPYAPENADKSGVPIAVVGENSPVYQASVAFLPEGTEPSCVNYDWIKKAPGPEVFELMSAGKRKSSGAFNPSGEGAGIYRPWMETMSGVIPLGYLWFQCVGDKGAISDILADVRRLGVMRRIGLGEVIAFSVNSISNSSSVGLLLSDGQPARELPCSDWPEGKEKGWLAVTAATRPPYWLPRNRELCWSPPLDRTVPGTYRPKRIVKEGAGNA